MESGTRESRTTRISAAVAGRVPKVFRLDSIKSRIVVLALLATLLPSLSMAWISYAQNKRALTDKITEELQAVSAQTAREIDLWLKERLYDVRVFASSYEVTENLQTVLRTAPASATGRAAESRLTDYLHSVEERFPDYNELLLVASGERVVATSAEEAGDVVMRPGWLDEVSTADQPKIGAAYWDEPVKRTLMTIAVPVRNATGGFLGALTARVNFRQVDRLLATFAPGETGQLFLLTGEGAPMLGSRSSSRQPLVSTLTAENAAALLDRESATLTYEGSDGNEVVGTLVRVPRLEWAVVAEIPATEAFAPVTRLRNLTLLLVSALLLGVGFLAYRLGYLIVRPLDRLTTGAAEVAAGDLAVDLPVTGKGEVGYLTEVFNDMVTRLRQGRQELERLLVTDPLTGLSNRRHLMEILENEARRSDRSKQPFALLMIDVDRFKSFNDTHGHVAGDEALKTVAGVMREATREIDTAARYGGEEFVILLPGTGVEGAVEAAERIRARLAEHRIKVGRKKVAVTASTGVAEYPVDGDSTESLIHAADAALYQAKRRGRDRVVRATRQRGAVKPTKKKKGA